MLPSKVTGAEFVPSVLPWSWKAPVAPISAPNAEIAARDWMRPVIFCDASTCRLPSNLAFAVKRTSGVNARRVGGVTGASFHGHAGRAMHTVADDFGVDANQWLFQGWAALANNGRFNSVDWRRATCGHPQVSNSEPLEGVRLGATEWPRICSERGIKHGFVVRRRCSWGGSPLRRRKSLARWGHLRPPTDCQRSRLERWRWCRPQRGSETSGRPVAWNPIPAHLQCKFLFLEYL